MALFTNKVVLRQELPISAKVRKVHPVREKKQKNINFSWQYHIVTQKRLVSQVSSTTNVICLQRYKILFTINNIVYFWLSCPFRISLKK